MKSLLNNTVSFIDRRLHADRFHSNNNAFAALAVGYSHLCETDTRSEPAGSVRCAKTATLRASAVKGGPSAREGREQVIDPLREAREHFSSCISSFRGTLILVNNDNVLARFGEVDDAVQCAVNLQIALNKRNAYRRADQQVRYRISIELCEADSRRASPASRGVSPAPGIESPGYASGIFVSRQARENLKDKSKVRFISLGKRYLPNCKDPVEVLWIEMDRSRLFDPARSDTDNALAKVS